MNTKLILMRVAAAVATFGMAAIAHGHGSSHPAKVATPAAEVAPYVKWEDGMRVLRYPSYRNAQDAAGRILVCPRPYVGRVAACTQSDEDQTNRWALLETTIPAGYRILGINYDGTSTLTIYLVKK